MTTEGLAIPIITLASLLIIVVFILPRIGNWRIKRLLKRLAEEYPDSFSDEEGQIEKWIQELEDFNKGKLNKEFDKINNKPDEK